ncbi:thiaminase II [Metabacillus iocasae]|uniref:Aminopyrimidine aminohydrolase n=1 Tax=Priestia iocasae TaxID=2291674 RepID=A0ABS2QTB0_9BACI|nr:thiaminase II [Metabacillus iocasae]MBM7702192.1 thiaminase/transcriptional activator TenA [Metabacillus iocasae]
MSFSAELRLEADHIYQAIFNHPFVKGIGEGNVPKEALIHYVSQDFEYLTAFVRIYAAAITKCENREEMAVFNEGISFVLNSEIHPHNNFCEVAGVKYEDLHHEPLAPTASHYIKHMMTVAHTGSLGEIIAVLLPCPWTYLEIGQKLIKDINLEPTHPFYEWITFYGAEKVNSSTQWYCDKLDELAAQASEEERAKMKDHFIKSCELEYLFWDMAYKQEKWLFPKTETLI